MASYHCRVRTGPKGKAAAHAMYLSRAGKYGASDRYEDLEAAGAGNMPAWAAHNPLHFWRAADEHERANGTAYREIEVALPRELTVEQRRDLVNDFVHHEFGGQHAYQWAIHCPKAALEKGDQPHAHIMYSQRLIDGLARDPDHYFKRYNRKQPERGGCQKVITGKLTERKAELVALRARWATVQNDHLARHGHTGRVDHRRLEEQGFEREAERHLGGPGVRQLSEADTAALLDRRVAEREHETAQDDVNVIDLSAALDAAKKAKATAAEIADFERLLNDAITAALEQDKRQRQQAQPTPPTRQEPVERELIANDLGDVRTPPEADTEEARIQGLMIWELEADIKRLQPPDFKKAIARHPDMWAAQEAHDQLETTMNGLHDRFLQAGKEAVAWREAHPLRTKLHDSGLKLAAFLVERQHIQQASREEHIRLQPQWDESQAARDAVYNRVYSDVAKAHAPLNAQITVLRQQIAEYQKINLDDLIQRNGLALRYDGGIEAQLDENRSMIRHLFSPDIDTHRRYTGRRLIEKYAQWTTEQKSDLNPTDKPLYQKALTAELGVRTGHFRIDDPPQNPDLVKQVQRDVDAMFKRLAEPVPQPTRSRSAQRERERERQRDRDDFEL